MLQPSRVEKQRLRHCLYLWWEQGITAFQVWIPGVLQTWHQLFWNVICSLGQSACNQWEKCTPSGQLFLRFPFRSVSSMLLRSPLYRKLWQNQGKSHQHFHHFQEVLEFGRSMRWLKHERLAQQRCCDRLKRSPSTQWLSFRSSQKLWLGVMLGLRVCSFLVFLCILLCSLVWHWRFSELGVFDQCRGIFSRPYRGEKLGLICIRFFQLINRIAGNLSGPATSEGDISEIASTRSSVLNSMSYSPSYLCSFWIFLLHSSERAPGNSEWAAV